MTKAITPLELFERQQIENFSLIDVREPDEYEAEHMDLSTLIPLAAFLSNPGLVKTDQPVVFICRSGKRSEIATDRFLSLFPDATAYNLSGGLLAWKAASLPLVMKNELD